MSDTKCFLFALAFILGVMYFFNLFVLAPMGSDLLPLIVQAITP